MKEGDVIDVVTALSSRPVDQAESEQSGGEEDGSDEVFKKGRVVVKQIGQQTRKGRWQVTLLRHKHFAIIR